MSETESLPPRWTGALRARLSALRLAPEREAEVVEELSQHLDDRWRELVAAGASAEEATRALTAELEGHERLERLKERMAPLRQSRQSRQPPRLHAGAASVSFAHDLWRDVRYACRALAAQPVFTAVAVLSLALGIGANTAVFSLINALVLRPVAGVMQPDSLVRLTDVLSYPAFEELAKRELFASTAAFRQEPLATAVDGTLQWSEVVMASGDFHRTLGVDALLGRTLTADDERARAQVAVLSHAFWMRAFGGDPDVLGKSIEIGRVPLTIVGVTPRSFVGLVDGAPAEVTVPVSLAPQVSSSEDADILTQKTGRWLLLIGRLSPGDSLQQANARLQAVWPEIAADASAGVPNTALAPAASGFSGWLRAYVAPLYVLMGLVAAVLLIACANVATLLLARAAARQRELAIRFAAGAGRGRVIRQLLTESLLLAGAAVAAGALLAIAGTRLVLHLVAAEGRSVALDLGPDARVLGFTVAVTTLTVLLFGLAPAPRATRVDVAGALKAHARSLAGGTRLRRGLVVAQVALSMLLVVSAALFAGSLQRVLAVDSGFDASQVLLVRADAVGGGYADERTPQFFTEAVERVSALPGVQSAALSWVPPVSRDSSSGGRVSVEGGSQPEGNAAVAMHNWVSPRYFETIGQELVVGRPIAAQDVRGAPAVAVVNETFVRRFLGEESPIGKRLDPAGGSNFTIEIVGVARDATYMQLKEAPRPAFYVPYAQQTTALGNKNMVLEVRSALPLDAAARDVRRAIAELDGNVIVDVESLQRHVDGSLSRDWLLALLSGLLGTISLVLVAIGLYGLMAYSVVQRTAEIGVRMALGAAYRAVLTMVLREAFGLVVLGALIGVLAALLSSRLIASLLFGVTPYDPSAFVAGGAVMGVIALLAALIPARRAARVDPMVALRNE